MTLTTFLSTVISTMTDVVPDWAVYVVGLIILGVAVSLVFRIVRQAL